jgi:hypothetical protein
MFRSNDRDMKWFFLSWLIAATSLGVISCDQKTPTTSKSETTSSSPKPADVPGAILAASPNPVPAVPSPGKTTITWNCGSDDAADVYVISPAGEKLFAAGAKGSQEAPWISPGSTTFQLRRHSDNATLAELKVTMPGAPASPSVTSSP